jgi:hypothetical protein
MIVSIYKNSAKRADKLQSDLIAAAIPIGFQTNPTLKALFANTVNEANNNSVAEPTSFNFDVSSGLKMNDVTKSKLDAFGNGVSVNVTLGNNLFTIVVLPNGTPQATLDSIATLL